MIFGWRLTRELPHIESDADKEVKALKLDLVKAKKKEDERINTHKSVNKEQAINHLRAAERYSEQMEQATGARVSQLKAIIDTRLEQAKNLGFELNGSITNTIQGLL